MRCHWKIKNCFKLSHSKKKNTNSSRLVLQAKDGPLYCIQLYTFHYKLPSHYMYVYPKRKNIMHTYCIIGLKILYLITVQYSTMCEYCIPDLALFLRRAGQAVGDHHHHPSALHKATTTLDSRHLCLLHTVSHNRAYAQFLASSVKR